MKVGVIYCAWNTEDMVARSLDPWVAARKSRLGNHEFVICAVSVPFESFPEGQTDDTVEKLLAYRVGGLIDHAITPVRLDQIDDDRKWKETEARGAALKWLVEQRCGVSWQVDSDEFVTPQQIEQTLAFFAARPHVAWAKGSLRNYVFTKDQCLVESFTPPRLHRTHLPGGWVASAFWDDNNVLYCREGPVNERREIRDIELPHVTVPKHLSIRHESWLSDDRSRKKQAYQRLRWGSSSFKWNEEANRLEWDESHFVARGLPFPPELQSD